MFFQFANVFVFAALAVVFVAGMLALSGLLRPENPEPVKLSTYECGEEAEGPAWMNFNLRFYRIALIFVIFDVEVAFLYPVATVFRDWVLSGRGGLALLEIGVFLAVLFTGLVVVWVRGDLEWQRDTAETGTLTMPGTTGAAG